jgi:hypothetical protein
VILMVMEYRSRERVAERAGPPLACAPTAGCCRWLPSGGSLEAVRDMLIADKVQARREFIRHQRGRHARTDEMGLYFDFWLQALEVDPDEYDELCASIDMA